MVKDKSKKDIQKDAYKKSQNVFYVLKHIWKWDKVYYVAYIPKISISVFMPLALLYYPKLLIDSIMNKSSDTYILSVIALYSFMLIITGIIQLFADAKINSTSYTFAIKFQNMVDIKAKSMDYENIENPTVHDMERQAYSGATSAENVMGNLSGFLTNLLGMFTYGSIIVLVHPLILLLLIISTIVNYLMMAYVRKWNDKNRDNWTHLDRRISYLFNVSQDYDRAKDIRIYNMKGWLTSLTKKYQGLRMNWSVKSWNKSILSTLVSSSLNLFRDGFSYAVLIIMLLNNEIDVGNFVFYFGAITGFSGWLSSIAEQYNSIASLSDDVSRLRAFLDYNDIFNHGKGIPLPESNRVPYDIELKNVFYKYLSNDTHTIDNINLHIKKGEKLAIVGVNGAGKTTLVKLLSELYYPTSGDIFIDSNNAKSYNVTDYYTQFSIVFQEILIIPVTIARFISGSGEDVDRDRVKKAIELADLDSVISKFPHGMDTMLVKGIYDDGVDLSGGEKQKLLLARALYKDAPVFILDEPTSALDPIAESELYNKYKKLTSGKTSIYISHRLASTRFCDRIILLQNGLIAECGSHDELMKKNGLYAKMFNTQSQYYKEVN